MAQIAKNVKKAGEFLGLKERVDGQKDELHELGYDIESSVIFAWRIDKLEKGLEEMWAMASVHEMVMKLDSIVRIVAIPFGCPAENQAYGRMTIDWGILVTQWNDYNNLRYTDEATAQGFDGVMEAYDNLLKDMSQVNREAAGKFADSFNAFKEAYQKHRPLDENTGVLEAEVLDRLLDGFGRKNVMPFGLWMIDFSWRTKHIPPQRPLVIQSAMQQKGEGGIQPFYKSKYGEGAGGGKTRET